MKNIVFQNRVEFLLPDHWISEELHGVGQYYEQGYESTLLLELMKASIPPGENLAIESLLSQLFPTDGRLSNLGTGIDCKFTIEIVDDEGVSVTSHKWNIANSQDSSHITIALFSFVVPTELLADKDVQGVIRMVGNQVSKVKFLPTGKAP